MFDFLAKLSHQHPKIKQTDTSSLPAHQPIQSYRQQSVQPTEMANSKKKKKKGKKLLSLSAQLQVGQCSELDPHILSLLERIKDESQTRLTNIHTNMIEQQKGAIQKKVYLRQMSNNNEEYLEEILIQSSSNNHFVRHGLAEIVDNIAQVITDDINFTDKYQIHKKININKDEVNILMSSIDHLKNKDGNIRDKVGNLRLQLLNEAQKINQRSIDLVEKKLFAPDHPKTKEVQVFLKSIQNKRDQERIGYEQRLRRQKQKRKQKQYQMEAIREKAVSERHERLVQVYQIKRKIKQQQTAMAKKRDEDFKSFLKTYKQKKPLFIEKEEQFQKDFIMKKEEEIFYKLLKKKQAQEPLSFEDIEDHEERYMDFKRDNQIRKKAEKKFIKETEKSRTKNIDELHKGKFRYYVLKQLVDQKEQKDPKEAIRQNKIKQREFSMNVKQFHKPQIDPTKKRQMQSLVLPKKQKNRYQNPIRMRINSSYDGGEGYYQQQRGQTSLEVDAKKDGENNRRYLKQYLREKVQKGEIKNKDSEQKERASTIQPRKKNYLEELRENRGKSVFKFDTIDQQINSIKNKRDIMSLKGKAEQFDERARRLQQKFKHVAHKPEEQEELENDYLYSIKAKIELLNNID